ncbi:unnamed protein product [Amoebophrya sp. A120]|nr:unnamed protein product [Amoebophrya sp. A120]|eukprot:GSA120T00022537001.1
MEILELDKALKEVQVAQYDEILQIHERKSDWLCPVCAYRNYQRNKVCRECMKHGRTVYNNCTAPGPQEDENLQEKRAAGAHYRDEQLPTIHEEEEEHDLCEQKDVDVAQKDELHMESQQEVLLLDAVVQDNLHEDDEHNSKQPDEEQKSNIKAAILKQQEEDEFDVAGTSREKKVPNYCSTTGASSTSPAWVLRQLQAPHSGRDNSSSSTATPAETAKKENDPVEMNRKPFGMKRLGGLLPFLSKAASIQAAPVKTDDLVQCGTVSLSRNAGGGSTSSRSSRAPLDHRNDTENEAVSKHPDKSFSKPGFIRIDGRWYPDFYTGSRDEQPRNTTENNKVENNYRKSGSSSSSLKV